jgi:hypothetical protein
MSLEQMSLKKVSFET